MRLTIDGSIVSARTGWTVLQAAREAGIPIPTLCWHEALAPYGACRLCLVELVSGRGSRLVTSCGYPCEEELVVRTNSDLIMRERRAVVELLMVTGAHLPLVRALADELGLEAPYVSLGASDCILCGLCVRACREIVGVGAISLTKRGMEREVTTPFQISSPDCIECGTCVLVCPTGAIRIDQVTRPVRTYHTWTSPYARMACRLCELDPPGPPFPTSYEDLLHIRREPKAR